VSHHHHLLRVALLSTTGVLAAGSAYAWRSTAALRRSRRKQYDLLYGLAWRETTTNNYGFAPSSLTSPERFQLQMYDELRQLLEKSGWTGSGHVLEISCGRGGGLAYLASRYPAVRAIGLDFSRVAIAFCGQHYAARDRLRFAAGDALALPFADGAFDVVIDVEASNRFGEAAALFREVARVLRPGGAFLYADSRISRKVPKISNSLERAGLHGELRDITENVRRSCEEDTPRRLQLLHDGLPWPLGALLATRLKSYAGVTGSRMYEKFRTHKREYFMGCLRKSEPGPAGERDAAAPARGG
jgi:SAM-dependent methyltransferase